MRHEVSGSLSFIPPQTHVDRTKRKYYEALAKVHQNSSSSPTGQKSKHKEDAIATPASCASSTWDPSAQIEPPRTHSQMLLQQMHGQVERHKAAACEACSKPFGTFFRRHHCRGCGRSLCHEHSRRTAPLPQQGIAGRVRVCAACFEMGPASAEAGTPHAASAPRTRLAHACMPHGGRACRFDIRSARCRERKAAELPSSPVRHPPPATP